MGCVGFLCGQILFPERNLGGDKLKIEGELEQEELGSRERV